MYITQIYVDMNGSGIYGYNIHISGKQRPITHTEMPIKSQVYMDIAHR